MATGSFMSHNYSSSQSEVSRDHYNCIAETQQTDQELHTLIASGTSLELKRPSFSSWVSRFGTPAILTTDRGRQFESSLFKALSKLLGVQKCRTTGYHPQANGMIEELHRLLKSAIKCHATERWTEVLPIILLGLRASLKEDILCTPSELVFGTTIRLPGEICKPAFFLNTEDLQLPQTKNETPATVEPNATASTPATVESDPTASTPTQPSTRSGRKVHLPTRYR
ncbi:integrase catalytic domain-containing protein [Trichonephila clavipes]|nr:integrase catalytic domain-containing protein [Trichonephila clavipes]